MKLYSENESYKLYQGNMLDMLEVIEPNTIDSIVTDPPYELNFMSKGWDNAGVSFQADTWEKCYEVLKPGGYLLAFGGSRTFHRIACAIEDAGFEIRDTIMWLYGSGFPKSMDISKQIDKMPNRSRKNMIRIGEIIKENRNKNNLTQRQLGELIGVSRELINLYEIKGNNQQQIPTQEQWLKIKEVLKLNDEYDYIFIEAEREVIGQRNSTAMDGYKWLGEKYEESQNNLIDITAPATDLAKQWQGWGTALKPSFEPIIVARKPFKGSLVDNVIEYGVGGINIDECRVGNEEMKAQVSGKTSRAFQSEATTTAGGKGIDHIGRFPANTILTYDETDFDEVCGGFPDTYGSFRVGIRDSKGAMFDFGRKKDPLRGYTDSGSASRYFMNCKYTGKDEEFRRYIYTPKASKKDRDEGLDTFNQEKVNDGRQTPIDNAFQRGETLRKNTHPTVKPTDLMQYLVRLVTPNNGTILDPFNGSGSTGKAVMYENKEKNKNYKYIGIELTEEYLPIAKARIDYVCNLKEDKLKDMQMTIFDYLESKGE